MSKLKLVAIAALTGIVVASIFWIIFFNRGYSEIQTRDIRAAEKLSGLDFSRAERDSMLEGVQSNLASFEQIRRLEMPNSVWPSLLFNPLTEGRKLERVQYSIDWNLPQNVQIPNNIEDLAFYTVAELAYLLRTRKVTSMQLTELFLDRIERLDVDLNTVITLTPELARDQARRADTEIEAGRYRGALHGIPYGTKDLLALEGFPTTWGAKPYEDQVIDETATVIRKLEEAGAVHLGKLSLGALAWGDVWFGARTNSPGNTEFGASGSSAGPAAAVAAGLAAFTIGSETYGSIVSPATRNGVTGLRPSYGRVSRHGAMALSWSMDKIGPITRSAEDAAIVFEAIYGPDPKDPTIIDAAFNYSTEFDFSRMRIGYVEAAFASDYPGKANDEATLEVLRSLGARLVPISLPDFPAGAISMMLEVEAAAAFDELTRSGRDSEMVRQIRNAWPNVFRTARTIPAVEYIQASRARTILQQRMHQSINEVDVYISPSFAGGNLLVTNLTGHPAVVLPNGVNDQGMPTSITFNGHLFDEGKVLSLARAYQRVTDFHRQRPPSY
ncbi:MAG: amidase [Balneolales bacterium]|nr:amidase [Balneolales bacterium]